LIRPIAVLVTAMGLSRPGIPTYEAKRYAVALNEIALANEFDPLLAVAMIHYETHWYPQLVSSDGEDHGLGQVRARFIGACRQDEDPLNAPSEACQLVKLSLLDGVENIRRMGSIIRVNMKFCREKMGKPKIENWLAGYQGYFDPVHRTYCVPGPKTTRVIEYYDGLLAKFYPKPKPKAKPAAPAKPLPSSKTTKPTLKASPPPKAQPHDSKSESHPIAKSTPISKKQRAEKPRSMPGASRQTRGGHGNTPRKSGRQAH
jgi:NOTCH protein